MMSGLCILHGAAAVHLVVPVESVNGVAVAVTFQPVPEPVASTAVIVSLPSLFMSPALRVAAHLIVDGAPTASEPAVTVAVPVIAHP